MLIFKFMKSHFNIETKNTKLVLLNTNLFCCTILLKDRDIPCGLALLKLLNKYNIMII